MTETPITRATSEAMAETRERFAELVTELRAELHRYCARMTGSVFDGEDVVQETLTKAHHALGEMSEPPALKPWLFRIAHNAAMDFQKRYERRNVELLAEMPEPTEVDEVSVDPELVAAALAVFVGLPPLQRSALILKDVLGHSLDEVANTLGTSVGATKAALFRARAGVERNAPVASPLTPLRPSPEAHASLQRYVTLFNERDWDALRALLAREAELDLVSRLQKRVVDAGYYHRYADLIDTERLRAESGFVDGVPAVAMFRPSSPAPAYFVLLEWDDGRVAKIRDFYHAPYVVNGARFTRDSG